jgi:SAM-dependent methyltransferase
MAKKTKETDLSALLKKKNQGIKLDIGCGANKQGPDWVGIDYRAMPGVDIVHDLTKFPWPLPDESVSLAASSHVFEHISPLPVDPRLSGLIDLLLDKKIIKQADKEKYIGEHNPGPIFMRMMDEIWRIMKPGGELLVAVPYATSSGFHQDPSHINMINEVTWDYFDPMGPFSNGMLWAIYAPKPWRIKVNTWHTDGNMEVVLVKRTIIEDKK